MVVEFTGVPGAGKSHLARLLVAALRAEGIPAIDALERVGPGVDAPRRLSRKAAAAGVELALHPIAGAVLLVRAVRSGQSIRQLARRMQNWLVISRLLRRARWCGGVHVFDQGLVQELHSFGYAGSWTGLVASAGGGHRRRAADLLVHVVVAPAVAADRLAARPSANSRLDEMDPQAQLAWLERQGGVLDQVVAHWCAVHTVGASTRLVAVDNDGADVDRLVRSLSAVVRSGGSGPLAG